MDLEKMTREELIQYIQDIQQKRAFSYEDQIKLAFIDNADVTLWASDRNCMIKYWSKNCERIYGYTQEEALDVDFTTLFVAEDEREAARKDQISIIDHGEVFHNIAYDISKDKRTLELLTYCWRMKDPVSGEFWNFEMAVKIDILEAEREIWKNTTNRSRVLRALLQKFIAYSKHIQKEYNNRKRMLNSEMGKCKLVAVTCHKKKVFEESTKSIRQSLNDFEVRLEGLVAQYTDLLKAALDPSEREDLIERFRIEADNILDEFTDVVAEFKEISLDYTQESENADVVGKDGVLRYHNTLWNEVVNSTINLQNQIDGEINEYKVNIGAMSSSNSRIKKWNNLKEQVIAIEYLANRYSIEIFDRVQGANTNTLVSELRKEILKTYTEYKSKLNIIKTELDEVR